MGASGLTDKYNLPLFVSGDTTSWQSFNKGMEMIDGILWGLRSDFINQGGLVADNTRQINVLDGRVSDNDSKLLELERNIAKGELVALSIENGNGYSAISDGLYYNNRMVVGNISIEDIGGDKEVDSSGIVVLAKLSGNPFGIVNGWSEVCGFSVQSSSGQSEGVQISQSTWYTVLVECVWDSVSDVTNIGVRGAPPSLATLSVFCKRIA